MASFPLVNRDFSLLWTGKTISQLGDKFYGIALAWWILEKTGSAAAMGLLLTLSVLPGLALGILCGPLVDRLSRKAILVGADMVRGLIVSFVALLSLSGRLSLGWVFAAAILLSMASAFFDPAAQAAIPQLVEPAGRIKANSLNQLTNGFAMVAGPILGALGVGLIGYTWVFAGNALSYFISGWLEAAIRLGPINTDIPRRHYGQELRGGFGFLRQNPSLRRVIGVVAVAHFFVAALMVSLPVLARNFGESSGIGVLGFLEAATGIGLVLGASFLGFNKNKNVTERGLFYRVLGYGVIFICLGLSSLFAPAFLPPLLISVLLYGGLTAQAGVFWSSILQERVPQELTGRVFSLSTLAGNAAMPLAFALIGFLLEKAPAPAVLLMSAVVLLIFSGILLAETGRRTAKKV